VRCGRRCPQPHANAFKFTFTGNIEVSLHKSGDAAELTIRDTGTGIPQEELPRLFDRFCRVNGARGRSYEGSGIGLALVQELVKLHGGKVSVENRLGRIWVESQYGVASTFYFTIPR
jgi:signal transduction histidine kinase